MTEATNSTPTRRDALVAGTGVAVGSALAGLSLPGAYAGESDIMQVALVGCGGRGTGAAANALATKNGPIKLVAMADVFQDRLDEKQKILSRRFKEQVEVTKEQMFLGFDAYKKAMDLLKPGDVVILATPPAFRWVMFQYAMEKKLNVFMEKPVTIDGPTSARMFKLADASEKTKMKVAVGLMCRHCDARNELFKRIKDGAIGDLTLLRAYRLAGPTGNTPVAPKKEGQNELEYQIRQFHGFLWLSGGAYSDFLIHNIDECCWMKDAWPVSAKSSGGRHYRGNYVDQNFDSYSTEFTFADGTKLYLEGRTIQGCHQEFASYAHGTKGAAVISESGHAPSHARTFKSHSFANADITWQFGKEEPDPYQLEWEHFTDAIRKDKPYNELRRGVEASLITAMGRMSAHTGRIITREDMLKCDHEFAPNIEKLVLGGESPLVADKTGKYPLPEPGRKTKREY